MKIEVDPITWIYRGAAAIQRAMKSRQQNLENDAIATVVTIPAGSIDPMLGGLTRYQQKKFGKRTSQIQRWNAWTDQHPYVIDENTGKPMPGPNTLDAICDDLHRPVATCVGQLGWSRKTS